VFFTGVMGQSLLPALATVQGELQRLNRIVVEVTSWLALLGLPAVATICVSAPYLLRVAYGTRYVGAAGPLSVASVAVLLTVLNAVLSCVLFAIGRPGVHRYAVAATAVTTIVAIYPACKILGPVGGQVAALLAIAVGYVLQLIRLNEVTGLDMFRYGGAFLLPGLGSASILAVVFAGRRLGLTSTPIADLALCAVSFVVACGFCGLAHLRTIRGGGGLGSSQTPESAAAL